MNEGSTGFDAIWTRVIETLQAAGEDPADPTPALDAFERSLLNTVQPVGQINGFVLLTTTSTSAKKLIEGDLGSHFAAVLHRITGEELQVVVTVADRAEETPAAAAPTAPQPQAPQPQQPPAPQPQQTYPPTGADPGYGYPRPGDDAAHFTEPGTNQQAAMRFGEQPGYPAPAQPAAQPPTGYPGPGGAMPPMPAAQPMTQPGQPAQPGYPAPEAPAPTGAPAPVSAMATGPHQAVPRQMCDPVEEPTLNPKYTFDTFVQGPQNKIAAAAAVAVAENPGRSYNPLYIAGPSGLGKTHLLHAIGHYALNLRPTLRLKYVSSEEFTNDFITSLREDAQESFKRRYRNLDVLLVDDIQFLAGKEGTQEEFFHTFNALYQTNRQIVLSSDRPPNQLVTLEDRLRTRFEQGLYADLSLPDLETRIAILQKKVEQLENRDIPEDVLIFIAQHTNTSIRALEGDLLQISAQASLLRREPSVELAREVLGTGGGAVDITPEIIVAATAEYFGLSIKDLESPRRSRPVSHARQVAMHLIRRMTNLSLVSIGAVLGGRDHATILHGDNKIEHEITENETTRREVDELTARIHERARM